jgi:hypothetical protein
VAPGPVCTTHGTNENHGRIHTFARRKENQLQAEKKTTDLGLAKNALEVERNNIRYTTVISTPDTDHLTRR